MVVICDCCEQELGEPGALLFSPPEQDLCVKMHICRGCYAYFSSLLGGVQGTAEGGPEAQG